MCISLMVDTCVLISSSVYNNAELCGPLVSVGSVGTSYSGGIGDTNLGNVCPTESPTTVAPTSSKPCCEELRLNPVFCCLEARRPVFMSAVCQKCGTGK